MVRISLREYFFESDLKYTLLAIVLFGILSVCSIMIPNNLLWMYEFMLFTLAFLHIILVVDPTAWMPFAVTHSVFASGFAIPISIVLARMVMVGEFALPNTVILVLLGVWWVSVVVHVILSESPVLSYFGGIERQMGLLYRLFVPVMLLAVWQVIYHMGYDAFYLVLLVGAILEVVVLTLQFMDDQHYIKFPFTYMETIGFRRYTGTLSNPIPVANFLLTILPLTLVFYNNIDFIFFIIAYLAISWGLFLSHGRGSYIATSVVSILEIVYVLVTPISWYLTLIALAVIVIPAIGYLFTPQGKAIKKRLLTTFDFVKKNQSKGESADAVQPPSAMNRIIIWVEAIHVFVEHPLRGYGISNIARAMRSKMSRKGARYFLDQVIDSAHNYYLDLLIEGGVTHLEIYLLLIGFSLYYSIIGGMPWLAIAVIGFSIDMFFSFPLQINYLVLMMIISVSAGFQIVSFASISYILFAIVGVYLINLYFSMKNNSALRDVQLALSMAVQGNTKDTLDIMLTALKAAPFEQRYFTVFSNILEELLSKDNLQFEDLHNFETWFEGSKRFVIDVSEAADITFGTIGLVYAMVYAKSKNGGYLGRANEYINRSLSVNPNTLIGRYAQFVLLNVQGDNIHAEEVLHGIIEDFLGSPYSNFGLENMYWQSYFNVLKSVGMNEKLVSYFAKYTERFKDVLTYKDK